MNSLLYACLIVTISVCACSKDDSLSEEEKKWISMKPIFEMSEASKGFHPPEHIADILEKYLEETGLSQKGDASLKACASARVVAKSSKALLCEDFEDPVECAFRHKKWQGNLRLALISKTMDLNRDGINDYIIRVPSCLEFNFAYTWQNFVILSKKEGGHKVDFTVNANIFKILADHKNDGNIIIEGINSYNGISLNVWMLNKSSYKNKPCFYQDKVYGKKKILM